MAEGAHPKNDMTFNGDLEGQENVEINPVQSRRYQSTRRIEKRRNSNAIIDSNMNFSSLKVI